MLALVAYYLKPVKLLELIGATSPNISIVLWPAKRSATMLRRFAWNHNVGLVKTSAHVHCNLSFRITVPECIASLDNRSCYVHLHPPRNKCQQLPTLLGYKQCCGLLRPFAWALRCGPVNSWEGGGWKIWGKKLCSTLKQEKHTLWSIMLDKLYIMHIRLEILYLF